MLILLWNAGSVYIFVHTCEHLHTLTTFKEVMCRTLLTDIVLIVYILNKHCGCSLKYYFTGKVCPLCGVWFFCFKINQTGRTGCDANPRGTDVCLWKYTLPYQWTAWQSDRLWRDELFPSKQHTIQVSAFFSANYDCNPMNIKVQVILQKYCSLVYCHL